MMRLFGKFVLTFGALALLASPVLAQGQNKGQGRGGFGGGVGFFFLMAENVQKDMKLSSSQVDKIQETLRDVREKHQDDYAGLRDASPEERQAKMAAIRKTSAAEVKKGLDLSADQSKRFDQISLQQSGLQAFTDPDVAAKLGLTADQKTKLREIATSGRGAGGGRGAFNKDASDEERAEARKKMAETRRENLDKAMAVLTDSQKSTWKELTGDPIEVQFPRNRPNN